jgi:transaldolase
MKIFVQTASLEQIRKSVETGLADGLVLSPVDMVDDDPSIDVAERVAELSRDFALPLCVPVGAVSGEDIYREGRELARASDQVIVQIPFVEDAVIPMRRLVADGVRVCATHVYSATQAFFATKVGATMVAIEAHDLDAHGQHSADVVAEIRAVLDQGEIECDLAVAPAQSAVSFSDHLLAGADIAYLSPTLIDSLMLHALTDRGVDRFLSALSRRHKPRPV